MTLAIDMRGVTKRYPRVIANQDAALSVRAGEIHAVVGENGAGKSTLMKVLAGVTKPDEGTVVVGGKPYQKYTPEEAARSGVGMVFQHFVLVPTLTVAENVVLGSEPRKGLLFDRARAEEEVRAVSARFGLAVDPAARVETCSIGVQQRVEILKVLSRGAQIIILDEPTAILTPAEVDELLAVLRRLAAEGKTIVLITHKLREVMAVAERITVMRAGRTVTTVEAKSTTADAIAEIMVGRPPKHEQRPPARERGAPVLEVRGLVARSDRGPVAVHGVDLTVHGGEIVGVAGIEGNGQTELIECITGLRPLIRGSVKMVGADVTLATVADRLALGMAHVPEDRHRRGVVLDFSIEENVILGSTKRYSRRGVIDRARMRADTLALVAAHDVRPPDPEARLGALSGGNQQKVVIGRELGRSPKLIIAAHPTRGLDLGAMEHVDASLVEARGRGVGVLLVSAELSELLGIADRIVVVYGGRIAGEVDLRSDTTDERALGAMMAGEDDVKKALAEIGVLVLAVLLSLAVGAVLIGYRGHDPFMVYGVWFSEALGTDGGRSQVIFKSTTLIFTGLASALAFRAGMFNIGAEGQIYLGAFCAAAMVFVLPAGVPLAFLWVSIAAFLGGGLAALVPAVLKVRRHTHEVITTMMMNFILMSVVNYLLHFARESAEVVRTPAVPAAWRLTRFVRGYDGNTMVIFAVVLAIFMAWFLSRARLGHAIRALGSSPGAAELGGIATGRVTLGVLVVSGAIAGLGGLNFVLGSPGYFEQHFAPFQGYLGIAVALLARNHPAGIVPAAFLFAVLAEGGQAIQEWAPPELGTILQAITVVFVVLGGQLFERGRARWEKAHA